MINTYNESSLHKTLKKLYSLENSYQTEVKKDGFVFDIISDKNEIIEIQTQSIEKLIPKIEYAIKNKKLRMSERIMMMESSIALFIQ